MIKIISSSDITDNWYNSNAACDKNIDEIVSNVLNDVKEHGDEAIIRLTKKFDSIDWNDNFLKQNINATNANISKDSADSKTLINNDVKNTDSLQDQKYIAPFAIDESEMYNAYMAIKKSDPDLITALEYAKENIKTFALKQKECFKDFELQVTPGVFAGQKTIPIERAGVYIPAGRYPLVSSVLMNVIPAIVSQVKEIVLCTPPLKQDESATQQKDYCKANRNILAAAYICGVKKAYAIGGAQAIGAMAFGTKSVPKCDVITGPGNAFVAAAKKMVYGTCAIDMVAGPTEVLIIADPCDCYKNDQEQLNPPNTKNTTQKTTAPDKKSYEPFNRLVKLVTRDMLSQAEHDTKATAILLTTNKHFAMAIQNELELQLSLLSTQKVARVAINENSSIVLCNDLIEAVQIANKKAPEHLELSICDKDLQNKIANMVHNYGSLFIAPCAEVFGDYVAGINHTLPTMSCARYTGGLSVRTFLKTVTTLRCNNDANLTTLATNSSKLAASEGLIAHKLAAEARLNQD